MTNHNAQLAALVGSRICHDLISPVGAIGNGLELMQMGGSGGAELALVHDSLANAQARIRFFRLAFGAAGQEPVAEAELRRILSDLAISARQRVHWQVGGDVPRAQARLVFLAIMCLENALPFGGEIAVTRDGSQWTITGKAQRMLIDEKLWEALNRSGADVTPSEVQFALLPLLLEEEGRRPRTRIGQNEIVILL
ncbi:histidine phosphotransferase family protein [Lacimonas salitolerans]|uniref:Histidine phosphotransferase family protein n=1 Tax=Lacimonas salitolerans TaxID=1323750 RepID=A0ABW4ELB7_9RHOB